MSATSGRLRQVESLRKRSDFEYVREHARKVVGSRMVIQIAAAPDDSIKMGVIASRRYNTRAVARNRAKRLVREAFRLIQSRIKPSTWFVVIVRRRISEAKCQDVRRELLTILGKANAVTKQQ